MKVKQNSNKQEKSSTVILDRGMNKEECRAVCTSPIIQLREKLFFRMIYETNTRPREVLEARIELWSRNTCEITFPKTKSKYNRWTKRHIPGSPKTMKLTQNTNEKEIDKWAKLLNIQKLQSIKPSGKEYRFVTLMALREAGERHP